MRLAIYARYSSERQNERSIDDQFAVLRARAADRGWAVVAAFSDAAISGAAMANRPGLLALLAGAEAGAFDHVLVEDEDRLARNLEHLAHIASRLDFAGVTLGTLATERVEELHVAFKGLQASQFLRNLSQKTRRGMVSNAEKGLATGSRLYGYRGSEGGQVTIVEAEAEVVREVFRLYGIDRLTPRQIADRLNRQGVPSPRGGVWNASSINGSRQRGNGILHTELYAGVKVWNRTEVRKDPRTGARLPRTRPPSEWRRTDVPHLRIVPDDLWQAARRRKADESNQVPAALAHRSRPGIFSGLFKCAACGSTYTGYGRGRLICAGHREKGPGFCANGRTVPRGEVEARVLDGLRTRLLTPEAVAAYVRLYHAAWAREDAARQSARAPLERRLAEVTRSVERLVDAICEGSATPATRDRLTVLEAEKVQLVAALAQADPSPAVTLHPKAAEAYAQRIKDLRGRLAEAAQGQDAKLTEAVRGLVERIDIRPADPRKGGDVEVTLHGRLALFVETSPGAGPPFPASGVKVVAGARYSLNPTCGAPVLRRRVQAAPER